jgi:hypothetical protein
MTFNIGHQTGSVINNVQGDQHITGGQHGIMVTAEGARQALSDLRQAIAASGLTEPTAAAAHTQMTEIETELNAARPDRARFAHALERLTRLLAAAGPLATASATLIGPLQALACWLGTLGDPILRLLPVLG